MTLFLIAVLVINSKSDFGFRFRSHSYIAKFLLRKINQSWQQTEQITQWFDQLFNKLGLAD